MSEDTGKNFTVADARAIGEEIRIDWDTAQFDVDQLRIGMNVELEQPSAPSNAPCSSGASRQAQQAKNAVRAYEVVYTALGA